jgi:hypothetical protein
LLLGLAEVIGRAQRVPALNPLRRVGRIVLVFLVLWTLHLIVCYRAQIQPHGEPLALRPITTEWRRWARQVYADTGLRMLIRRAAPRDPTAPGLGGER